jgi:hypothetical protein
VRRRGDQDAAIHERKRARHHEAVKKYGQIAYYANIWLVEFRDYSTCLVIEESEEQRAADTRRGLEPQENYIIEEEGF